MSWLDDVIREAMERGDFDHVNKGKKLDYSVDPNVPENMRTAYAMLQDQEMTLDWIAQGKALDAIRSKLLKDMSQAYKNYQQRLAQLISSRTPELDRQASDQAWEKNRALFKQRAVEFNRELLSYNLKLPRGVTPKLTFEFERELKKLV